MIRSSIWWNCAKLVEKLLQKQQERLLYFDIFRHHMSSYCIKPPVYIKTVDTDSKYKCIVMRGNDPSRVDRGEGYRVVNRLNCCDVFLGVDDVHPGSY